MNIKQVADILGQERIQVEVTADSLHVIPSFQDENIYKLEKRGNQRIYLFIQYERGSGKETILETFQSEEEAAIYFLLVTLQSSFYHNYIFPNKEKNASLNMGNPNFTIADLQTALSSLHVGHVNYSIYDEATVPHSKHLSRVTPSESKVQFIGKNNQVVIETMELENWDAYSVMFDFVYLLALLDEIVNRLVQANQLKGLSDDEIATFLTA
ncbi:hypothetical protein HPT25_14585 [Bacillus sp. BRMEA1]|uniref:hypothetical protein n=1 Tax=Neobacillus endophyticus TaxID=2738405 RepID=UPI001565FF11|nr:hypothetical protein [Neobacillus endophyticus]NRD78587.1 hypothetical protein [Neobacillus endophyticus]